MAATSGVDGQGCWRIAKSSTGEIWSEDIGDGVDQRVDQALREKEEQYRAVFEASGDGLIIRDRDEVVVEANPAMCRMHGYTRAEFIGLHLRDFIHPEAYRQLVAERQRVDDGGSYFARARHLRKDGSTFFIEAHGSAITYQGRPHVLGVVRDVTERVRANELLERRVEERTRELASLLDVSRDVASTLELEPLLDVLLAQVAAVVPYLGAAVFVLDGEDALRLLRYRGPLPQERLRQCWPLSQAAHSREVFRSGRPVIIPDVRKDTPAARGFREKAILDLGAVPEDIACWMGVPLVLHGRVIGLLAFDHDEPGSFGAHHAELALAVGSQAAVAIEHARLYEQVGRHAREVEALYRADEALHRSLRLEDVSQALVDETMVILRADKTSVLIWDEAHARLVMGAARGFSPRALAGMVHVHREGVTGTVAKTGRAIAVADARSDPRVAHRITDPEGIGSLLHVPVTVGNEVFGVFGVNYCRPHALGGLGGEEERVLSALAQRAALAIANAKLYEWAQEAATMAERQRLAAALTKQVEALRARHSLAVTADLEAEPEASLPVKEALYRIAQEALHNVVKHARASAVALTLRQVDAELQLEVVDDGAGFDPAGDFPGHLGLRSMRERAAQAGGSLVIESAGQGHTPACGHPGGSFLTERAMPEYTAVAAAWSVVLTPSVAARRDESPRIWERRCRFACCSPTTTPSCARACGCSSRSIPNWRSSARRPTARTRCAKRVRSARMWCSWTC